MAVRCNIIMLVDPYSVLRLFGCLVLMLLYSGHSNSKCSTVSSLSGQ